MGNVMKDAKLVTQYLVGLIGTIAHTSKNAPITSSGFSLQLLS